MELFSSSLLIDLKEAHCMRETFEPRDYGLRIEAIAGEYSTEFTESVSISINSILSLIEEITTRELRKKGVCPK